MAKPDIHQQRFTHLVINWLQTGKLYFYHMADSTELRVKIPDSKDMVIGDKRGEMSWERLFNLVYIQKLLD